MHTSKMRSPHFAIANLRAAFSGSLITLHPVAHSTTHHSTKLGASKCGFEKIKLWENDRCIRYIVCAFVSMW
jgi:hypothetical protein